MGMQDPNGRPGADVEGGTIGQSSGPMGGQVQSVPRGEKLFDPNDNSHLAHLPTIAASDSNGLLRAHGHYGNSWKFRGGIGAFMMLARKWDRLEKLVAEKGYDIFRAMKEDARGEGIIDDIRDLRRYLLLVEAEATARGFECCSVRHRDNLEETARATERQKKVIVVGGEGSCLNVMQSPKGKEVIRRLVDGDPAINAADDRHEAQARVFKEAFGTEDRDPGPSGSVSDPQGRE